MVSPIGRSSAVGASDRMSRSHERTSFSEKAHACFGQYSGFSPDWQIQFLRHWPLMTDAGSSELSLPRIRWDRSTPTCCWRAMARPLLKYASAFVASCSGETSVSLPAMRLTSASNQVSFDFSMAAIERRCSDERLRTGRVAHGPQPNRTTA
jgi:hypothetical protein